MGGGGTKTGGNLRFMVLVYTLHNHTYKSQRNIPTRKKKALKHAASDKIQTNGKHTEMKQCATSTASERYLTKFSTIRLIAKALTDGIRRNVLS